MSEMKKEQQNCVYLGLAGPLCVAVLSPEGEGCDLGALH